MVSEIKTQSSLTVESGLEELIALGAEVVSRRLAVGSGGNLSFRVPNSDLFYITGTGTQLDQLTPESFALLNLSGEVLSTALAPSSEYRVHLESYRSRPDAAVCIHLHPQASVLTASLDLDIQFVTIDHVYYVRKVSRIPWIKSGTQEIAEATALALHDSNVVILENHGCVIIAASASLGLARVLNLEEAAELTLRSHEMRIIPTPVPKAYWEHLKANGL